MSVPAATEPAAAGIGSAEFNSNRWAGWLDRIAVGAALGVLVLVALAAVLAGFGWWTPWVAAPNALVVVVVVARVVARLGLGRALVPTGSSPAAEVEHGSRWWAIAVLGLAVGAGVWAGLTHGEHVVVRRDAGTYAQFGHHLATTGGTRVDVEVAALGGQADPAVLNRQDVTVGSPGFYARGDGDGLHVVPQFMIGTPALLSIGWWWGGWTGLLLVPSVVLGAAVLAFGVLARRLVGPGWAVLATATLATAYPVLHTGRATYSEPLALLLVCAGGALAVDAIRSATAHTAVDAVRRRVNGGALAAPIAGVLIGGAALVRADALREVALLFPVIALLAVRRHPAARPLLLGALAATGFAAVVAAVLTLPYLGSIAGSLVPLVGGAVVLGVASWQVVVAARRGRGLPRRWRRWLPPALAATTMTLGVLVATRPWWQIVRQDPADRGSRVVAGLQAQQGLPVDGGRTYAEQTVAWVGWWVGVPALLLACGAVVVVAYRAGQVWRDDRPIPGWLGPVVVGVGSTALTLYRPGITPDHPWADRRLVPVVLPTIVLLAVAAVRWVAERAARWTAEHAVHRAIRPVQATVAAVGAGALLVPTAIATAPLVGTRTELGEVAAVRGACQFFRADDTAVLVDSRVANEWTQVLRGVCDVPTVAIRVAGQEPVDPVAVAAVTAAVRAAGRRPVLVAAEGPLQLQRLAVTAVLVVDVATREDQRLLTRRPDGTAALAVQLWAGLPR
ncbi:MAG: hypothetical protein ACRC35_03370 [Angustibacter sp.]